MGTMQRPYFSVRVRRKDLSEKHLSQRLKDKQHLATGSKSISALGLRLHISFSARALAPICQHLCVFPYGLSQGAGVHNGPGAAWKSAGELAPPPE